MRKNTRLSLHAQVQFCIPEQRSLGTRVARDGLYIVKYECALFGFFQGNGNAF